MARRKRFLSVAQTLCGLLLLALPLTACNSTPPNAGQMARNGPGSDMRARDRGGDRAGDRTGYPPEDRGNGYEYGSRRERREERREDRGQYRDQDRSADRNGGYWPGEQGSDQRDSRRGDNSYADSAAREGNGNGAPLPPRGRGGRNHATSAAGFDFYLLNLSWSPEFCHGHPDAPECAAHAGFVLHGLWPQNTDGTYPDRCSAAPGPSDPGRYGSLYPSPSLLQHEWQAHGTCSGLSPEAYLQAAASAVHSVVIPPALAHASAPTTLPPDQILGLFAQSNPGLPRASLALSCGNNYLTAVEVCLDKGLHPIACSNVRSCRADVVRISPR